MNHNKVLIVGNWKMNLGAAESKVLAHELATATAKLKLGSAAQLVLCPNFVALPAVAEELKKTSIAVGAQDVFWKEQGPYTGEVSPGILVELGVTYVIIGHSERRQYLRESEAMVQQKVAAAVLAGLIPIICVGETLAERTNGEKEVVVTRQLRSALNGLHLPPHRSIVIAYEPVWVIGSGQSIQPREAHAMAGILRQTTIELLGQEAGERQASFLYGGSVDAGNVNDFIGGYVSGVLVGGASQSAKYAMPLIKAVARK